MPRPKPLVSLHGAVNFDRLVPFNPANPLAVNDILVMRRAGGGDNKLVTVGDIQTHGGSVNIADLLGGANDDMLHRIAGVWTGTGPTGLKFDGVEMQFDGTLCDGIVMTVGAFLDIGGTGTLIALSGGGDIVMEDTGQLIFDGNGGIDLQGTGNLKMGTGFIRAGSAGGLGETDIGFEADTNTGRNNIGPDEMADVAGAVNSLIHKEIGGGVIHAPAAETALVAFPTGGQASAVVLLSSYNVIATCATAGDSVKLPDVFNKNSLSIVKNDGAQAADVFPAVGDNIGAGVNVAISLPAGEYLAFIATTANSIWTQLLPRGEAAPVFPLFQFPALQLENPNNADWTVNALAPAIADSNNAGLTVRAFDDTIEEGVGFTIKMPSNSDGGPGANTTDIVFTVHARAETAPPGDRDIRYKFYHRTLPDNLVVTPWDSGVTFTNVTFPANEFFQEFTFTISFFAFGLEPDELVQFEMTRVAPQGGNANLPGDMILSELQVSFA